MTKLANHATRCFLIVLACEACSKSTETTQQGNSGGGSASTFTVTYSGNGNTGGTAPADSMNYSNSATVTVLGNSGNLVKTGNTFVGWNSLANGSGTIYAPSTTFSITSNRTLYARWTTGATYSVTYDGNGNTSGSVPTDGNNYVSTDSVILKTNSGGLAKTGSSFIGWNTQANGAGSDIAPGTMVTMGSSNRILYAKWTTSPAITVTYDGNGNSSGSAPSDASTYAIGNTVTVLGNTGALARTSYSFVAWATLADGSGFNYAPGATFTIGSNNVTLYAKWAAQITRSWIGISGATDGTKLAAVVDGTFIYASDDSGITWFSRDSARSWRSIACSSDCTKLVAAGSSTQIYTSANSGLTWTARDSSRSWQSVTSSSDGTKLAAVDGLAGFIYTSADSGVTWTARDSARNWRCIASSGDGSKLVAGVYLGQIYTSTDSGLTWTARESNRDWKAMASSSDGTKLVAVVNSGQIYTSTDSGVTWTARDSNRPWSGVASSADGTKLAAAVSGGQIYTSSDSGVTWTATATNRAWSSITISNDGTKLAAAVYIGMIFVSTDSGATWISRF